MTARRIVKIALWAVAALLFTVLCYVAYVLLSYDRIPDNVPLEPQNTGKDEAIRLNVPYRAVTQNVGFGAYTADFTFFMDGGKESRARSPEAVYENVGGAIGAVQAQNADFVLLQEVDLDGTRSYHIDQMALVWDAMGETYHSTFAQNYDSPYLFWPLLEPHGANRSGLGTLSRYPISSALRRSLPVEDSVMKLVDCDRCYSVCRIPVGDGQQELVLYNLHLSAYTSDGTIAEEQIEMLFADMLVEYEKGNYAGAGGDFNKDLLGDSTAVFGVDGRAYTWAQPIPAEIIPAGISVVAPLDEANPVPSCRNPDMPYGPENYVVMVDGFAVTDNVEVVASSVIDEGFRWSDHTAVYRDFVLEK